MPESDLTRALRAVFSQPDFRALLAGREGAEELLTELESASHQVFLASKFYNDAVAATQAARQRWLARRASAGRPRAAPRILRDRRLAGASRRDRCRAQCRHPAPDDLARPGAARWHAGRPLALRGRNCYRVLWVTREALSQICEKRYLRQSCSVLASMQAARHPMHLPWNQRHQLTSEVCRVRPECSPEFHGPEGHQPGQARHGRHAQGRRHHGRCHARAGQDRRGRRRRRRHGAGAGPRRHPRFRAAWPG